VGDGILDSKIFRQAWGNFATGVALVTTIEQDGTVHGMTANGVASISLDPMLVMVCVGHKAKTYPIIKESGRYGINILSEYQEPIGSFYASSESETTHEPNTRFHFTESGTAFLDGALSSMDCNVVRHYDEGDHTIFIGEVESIEVKSGSPLIFFNGKWALLAD